MRVQRKIVHLLDNNGVMGAGFRYVLRVNPVHNFDFNMPFYVTDKIDGTTCQADNRCLYKRFDKFKAGDPRKFTATEEERYELRILDEEDPANKWIFMAYNKFKDRIAKIPDGYIVYFEAFGEKIQSRYKGLQPSIRVFDLAKNDEYLPFLKTLMLSLYGLPIVCCNVCFFKNLTDIVSDLKEAIHIDIELKSYPLEGWVLRQGEQIAKIRKADLKKIEEGK